MSNYVMICGSTLKNGNDVLQEKAEIEKKHHKRGRTIQY